MEPAPVVAVTFHHDAAFIPETRSAFEHYADGLADVVRDARERGWRLIGHEHPRWRGGLAARWRRLGVETVERLDDVFAVADVLVADNTSAMWEFASLGRPIVLLDAPWYRRDVEHGLRFWEHANAGPRVAEAGDVVAAVELALLDPDPVRAMRERAVAAVYHRRDGRAAERAATAIVDRLEQ